MGAWRDTLPPEGGHHVATQRNPKYWLDLFTGTTWKEFRNAGASVSGFRESRWRTVQKIQPGDMLLCYLTGLSRWVGILEVTSKPFQDSTPIWSGETFPCRMKVKPIVAMDPEYGVPVLTQRDRLSFFQNMVSPIAWTGQFRGSPKEFKRQDAEVIVADLRAAQANPVAKPVDPRKLAHRPTPLRSALGAVVIPEPEPARVPEDDGNRGPEPVGRDESTHTEIQWLLLKLGSDMGLDVWVARNDRGRAFRGVKFADLLRYRAELPRQFDEATNRTVELIDVLWLQGNAIVAAFEVESTTSIYSGLLRMADLVSMQPNLKIPLYLVAPEDKRNKVFSEVNRPTFARLKPPLYEVCRYISFSDLRERMQSVASVVQYLKPEFLEDIAESCEVEEPEFDTADGESRLLVPEADVPRQVRRKAGPK
jgi:predicted RNA-binding protein